MALSKWYKIDFHTHSPESNCFPDKSVKPEEWIKAAKDSGMNAVVVCDHNSVGYIRKLEEKKGDFEEDGVFKIFYGIELCVSADFTHFIIIFDDKLTVMDIEDAIISKLDLQRSNWGNTEINVSEDKLKKLCQELKDRIFVIPAHFASNKGLGKSRINEIKKYQEFVSFPAVEVRNKEDIDEYENKRRLNAMMEATLITGSDNPSSEDETKHSIEGFGKMFTWVKMSTLSFDGLRQVFIDPEYRCINWTDLQNIGIEYNPNEITNNYISGITIEGLTHVESPMSMRFSPNLNCIVGGRGTGKSTIVESINYGVCNETNIQKCSLIDKTFSSGGKISTYYNFGTGKSYQIDVNRKVKQLNVEVYDENGFVDNPPEFNIDFYGQKDIFALIEDDDDVLKKQKSPLIEMIDRKGSTEVLPFNDAIKTALNEMVHRAEEYKTNKSTIKELPTILAEKEKAEAILQKYKASGIERLRNDYEKIDQKIKMIETVLEEATVDFHTDSSSYEAIETDCSIRICEMEDTDPDRIYLESLQKIAHDTTHYLREQEQKVLQLSEKYLEADSRRQREEIHEKYLLSLKEVQNVGGEDIGELQDKVQKNKKRYDELIELQKKQTKIEELVNNNINLFVDSRIKLTEKRKEIIANLGLENIKISISPLGHANRWKAKLQEEFGKEGIFDNDFQSLVEHILKPDDNFENYKKFLRFLLMTDTGNVEDLGIHCVDARFQRLWKDKFSNDTINSLVKVIPEDKLQITILEENGEININEGSPGQKSAAILAFILNSGDNPLIIDQPEDDLDNSLIYSLIVKSIRKKKNKRQIIIVTHNPNIPVLGDAEGIIILERNDKGKVTFRKNKKAGGIEENLIREGICEIMEGGEEAFKKREQKYQHKL